MWLRHYECLKDTAVEASEKRFADPRLKQTKDKVIFGDIHVIVRHTAKNVRLIS